MITFGTFQPIKEAKVVIVHIFKKKKNPVRTEYLVREYQRPPRLVSVPKHRMVRGSDVRVSSLVFGAFKTLTESLNFFKAVKEYLFINC